MSEMTFWASLIVSLLLSLIILLETYFFNKIVFGSGQKFDDKLVVCRSGLDIRFNSKKKMYYAQAERTYFNQPLEDLPKSKFYKTLDDVKQAIDDGSIVLK